MKYLLNFDKIVLARSKILKVQQNTLYYKYNFFLKIFEVHFLIQIN